MSRRRTVLTLALVEFFVFAGEGMVVTALGWQAYSRQHSPLVLGLLGLAEFLPAVILALPAGHVADRQDRRRVAGAGMVMSAAVTLVLAADAGGGDTAVWPLYALALAWGVGNAFSRPTLGPLLAAAVDSPGLARAFAIVASAGQVAIVAGPLLAGVLQIAGAPLPYVTAAIATVAGGVLLVTLPSGVGRVHLDEAGATAGDVFDGLRFIGSNRPLLGAFTLDLIAVLFGGAPALFPVFARDILHIGAVGNGALRAASGIGAAVVAALLTVAPLRRRIGITLLWTVSAFGVLTIIFGLSRNLLVSLLAVALLAGADMVSVVIRATLVPVLTPPGLRGRVAAVERVFIGASNELGAFESGTVAALIGAVPTVIAGGVVSVVVAALWTWWFPQLRRIDTFDDAGTPAGGDGEPG